jgi:hypothetical protein
VTGVQTCALPIYIPTINITIAITRQVKDLIININIEGLSRLDTDIDIERVEFL